MAHKRAPERGEARVGADELDRFVPARPDRVGGPFQQRRRDTHAGQRAHLAHEAFFKAPRVARDQLQRGVSDDPFRELRHGAREARGGDLRGEQQRDARGDAHDREQLLQQARAQPHAVEVQNVPGLHSCEEPSQSRGP